MEKNKQIQEMIEMAFPYDLPTVDSLIEKYPKRELAEGAMVTRIAPSPTGFMHVGSIYTALISERFAHQTNGVFYLRIEDTDQKREVEGARKVIVDSLHEFALDPDEGESFDNDEEVGEYGPYRQSKRKEIYQAFVKDLLKQDKAYLCFCSEDEIEKMRQIQEELKIRPGYYGPWAKWRDADIEKVIDELKKRTPFVVRFKSRGDHNKTILHKDLIKGDLNLSENDVDGVIMKSDGLPTYHFAHAVDDHLMGTTHVLRGDEWVSSIPFHYELFDALGFNRPLYGHIAPINKINETGGKRKLSKRKDPEANVSFYAQKGYPPLGVIEYLMNLANSDFEDWRRGNPNKRYTEFNLVFDKLPKSAGPLFDEMKLRNISKNLIRSITAEEVYEFILEWSRSHDKRFFEYLSKDREYWLKIFAIERKKQNPRSDIVCWSEVPDLFEYFNRDKDFNVSWNAFQTSLNIDEIRSILERYRNSYEAIDSREKWFSKIVKIAEDLGFAPDIKTYKKYKSKYRGHVGEISQVVRYAITGRTQTPDLYEIMVILGAEECNKRLVFKK